MNLACQCFSKIYRSRLDLWICLVLSVHLLLINKQARSVDVAIPQGYSLGGRPLSQSRPTGEGSGNSSPW